MQKIKDVLRLHLAGGVTSRRQLARIVGCSKMAVSDCLRRAHVAGLSQWPAVESLDEEELERRLYPSQANTQLKGRRPRPEPDWGEVRAELARRDHHVTLALLWQEYKAQQPDGYQYSQFCDLYRRFEKKLSVVLRQAHRGGEKTFVDFCDGIPLIDAKTGELTALSQECARFIPARLRVRPPEPRRILFQADSQPLGSRACCSPSLKASVIAMARRRRQPERSDHARKDGVIGMLTLE